MRGYTMLCDFISFKSKCNSDEYNSHYSHRSSQYSQQVNFQIQILIVIEISTTYLLPKYELHTCE